MGNQIIKIGYFKGSENFESLTISSTGYIPASSRQMETWASVYWTCWPVWWRPDGRTSWCDRADQGHGTEMNTASLLQAKSGMFVLHSMDSYVY